MKWMRTTGIGFLALSFALSGCYGPFRLTRNLHRWNGEVGDKWANEVVFLVLVWVPVYGLATLGDALIFNSIEFWTGDNPIESTALDATERPRTRSLASGDAEARLTRVSDTGGEEFVIEQYNGGRPVEGLRIRKSGNVTVACNSEGETLYTASTLADGSVIVKDAQGRTVATRSAEEMRLRREAQSL